MKKEKAFYFIGGMFPKDSSVVESKSKNFVQNAANVFQWNLIEGMRLQGCNPVLVSLPFVGAWPSKYSDFFVRSHSIEKDKKAAIHYVGFVNLLFYRNISRYLHLKKFLSKEFTSHYDEDIVIVVYAAHTPFIKAISKLKEKYRIHFHLVVPDLPQYMNLSSDSGLIYRLLKKCDMKQMDRLLVNVDSFTFLTSYMNDAINKWQRPFTIVEGMINENDRQYKGSEAPEKTVVYTGGMCERYGVKLLVDASVFFDEDIRLVLCGSGDMDEYIREKSKTNSKIVYKGLVSRQEALAIQSKAMALTNPRFNEGEYVKYSFPSKVFEYMLWGKPVITFKLAGVPDEYDKVLVYYEDTTPKSIADKINEIARLTSQERGDIGRKTFDFAVNNKNIKVQTSKILKIIESSLASN